MNGITKSLLDSVCTVMTEKAPTEKKGDGEDYEKFFQSALKKFGVKSPAELEADKKDDFFDYVDKNWKGDNEKKESFDLANVDAYLVEIRGDKYPWEAVKKHMGHAKIDKAVIDNIEKALRAKNKGDDSFILPDITAAMKAEKLKGRVMMTVIDMLVPQKESFGCINIKVAQLTEAVKAGKGSAEIEIDLESILPALGDQYRLEFELDRDMVIIRGLKKNILQYMIKELEWDEDTIRNLWPAVLGESVDEGCGKKSTKESEEESDDFEDDEYDDEMEVDEKKESFELDEAEMKNWLVTFSKSNEYKKEKPVEVKARSTREAITKAGKKLGMDKKDALAFSDSPQLAECDELDEKKMSNAAKIKAAKYRKKNKLKLKKYAKKRNKKIKAGTLKVNKAKSRQIKKARAKSGISDEFDDYDELVFVNEVARIEEWIEKGLDVESAIDVVIEELTELDGVNTIERKNMMKKKSIAEKALEYKNGDLDEQDCSEAVKTLAAVMSETELTALIVNDNPSGLSEAASATKITSAKVKGDKIDILVAVRDDYNEFDVKFTYDGKKDKVTSDTPMQKETGYLISALLRHSKLVDSGTLDDYAMDTLG